MVEQKEETTANLSSHDSASLLSYFKTSCDQPCVYILKYDNHSRGYVICHTNTREKGFCTSKKELKRELKKELAKNDPQCEYVKIPVDKSFLPSILWAGQSIKPPSSTDIKKGLDWLNLYVHSKSSKPSRQNDAQRARLTLIGAILSGYSSRCCQAYYSAPINGMTFAPLLSVQDSLAAYYDLKLLLTPLAMCHKPNCHKTDEPKLPGEEDDTLKFKTQYAFCFPDQFALHQSGKFDPLASGYSRLERKKLYPLYRDTVYMVYAPAFDKKTCDTLIRINPWTCRIILGSPKNRQLTEASITLDPNEIEFTPFFIDQGEDDRSEICLMLNQLTCAYVLFLSRIFPEGTSSDKSLAKKYETYLKMKCREYSIRIENSTGAADLLHFQKTMIVLALDLLICACKEAHAVSEAEGDEILEQWLSLLYPEEEDLEAHIITKLSEFLCHENIPRLFLLKKDSDNRQLSTPESCAGFLKFYTKKDQTPSFPALIFKKEQFEALCGANSFQPTCKLSLPFKCDISKVRLPKESSLTASSTSNTATSVLVFDIQKMDFLSVELKNALIDLIGTEA